MDAPTCPECGRPVESFEVDRRNDQRVSAEEAYYGALIRDFAPVYEKRR